MKWQLKKKSWKQLPGSNNFSVASWKNSFCSPPMSRPCSPPPMYFIFKGFFRSPNYERYWNWSTNFENGIIITIYHEISNITLFTYYDSAWNNLLEVKNIADSGTNGPRNPLAPQIETISLLDSRVWIRRVDFQNIALNQHSSCSHAVVYILSCRVRYNELNCLGESTDNCSWMVPALMSIVWIAVPTKI